MTMKTIFAIAFFFAATWAEVGDVYGADGDSYRFAPASGDDGFFRDDFRKLFPYRFPLLFPMPASIFLAPLGYWLGYGNGHTAHFLWW